MECKNSSEVVPIDLLLEVLHHVCFTYRGCFVVGSSWGSRGGGGGGGGACSQYSKLMHVSRIKVVLRFVAFGDQVGGGGACCQYSKLT